MIGFAEFAVSPGGATLLSGLSALGKIALPAATACTSRHLSYANNRSWPNLRPELSDIIASHLRGYITWGQMAHALLEHGVSVDPTSTLAPSPVSALWQRVIDAQRPQIDLGTAYASWCLNRMTDDDWSLVKRRNGWEGSNWLPWMEQPSQPFDLVTLLALYNRGLLTEPLAYRHMRALGFGYQEDRDKLLALSQQIPGPSDLVSFALKEVWDQATVDRFGYDQEFPPEFAFWMGKQGYNWGQDVTLPDGRVIPGVSWPSAYWRAHWDVISPEQAYEMLHRLRGDPTNRNTWAVPGVRPFTADDVNTILKVHDYPPPFREQLAAISYNVISRRDIATLWEASQLTADELVSCFQDQGYQIRDARKLAEGVKYRQKSKDIAKSIGQSRSRIEHAYEVGTLTRVQASVALWYIGHNDYPQNELQILSPDANTIALANGDGVANAALSAIDHEIATKVIVKRIEIARKRYITGQLTLSQVQAVLMTMGVADARIASYLSLWSAEAAKFGREVPASLAQKLHRKGLIDDGQLYTRLTNIGYLPADAGEMVLLAQMDIAADLEKAIKAKQAAAEKQQKAKDTAAKGAKAAAKEALAAERYSLSKADILKAYKDGVMKRDEATGRLMMTGTTYADAKTLLDDVDASKKGKPSGSQTQGGSGGTSAGG